MRFKPSETMENGESYGTMGGSFTTISLARSQKFWWILQAISSRYCICISIYTSNYNDDFNCIYGIILKGGRCINN